MTSVCGWIGKGEFDRASGCLHGVELDPELPTRWEEYEFVRKIANNFGGTHALDAGSGYVPNWHIMPELLANIGYEVVAIDCDMRSLMMPERAGIMRFVGDMTDMPFDDEEFDLITSISVVEHVSPKDRVRFFREAHRLLRPGGIFVVTCDELEPTRVAAELVLAGFDECFINDTKREHLEPRVSFAYTCK